MKVLKILGWVFVPYIMIWFNWKSISSNIKVPAVIWSVLCLVIVFSPKNQTLGPERTSATPPVAPVSTEVKTKAEAEAKQKAEEEAKEKAEEEAKVKIEAEEKAKADAEEAKKKAEEIPHSIGMNADQFKKAFNEASNSIGTDLKIGNLKIEEGPMQNTFNHSFTKNLSMVGIVNKIDGSVRSVTFIGAGDGTAKSGADIILSMGLAIMTTNPELSENDRGNILRELGLMDGGDVLNLDKDTIRNGIKYSLNTSKELGIWFTASSANDK